MLLLSNYPSSSFPIKHQKIIPPDFSFSQRGDCDSVSGCGYNYGRRPRDLKLRVSAKVDRVAALTNMTTSTMYDKSVIRKRLTVGSL